MKNKSNNSEPLRRGASTGSSPGSATSKGATSDSCVLVTYWGGPEDGHYHWVARTLLEYGIQTLGIHSRHKPTRARGVKHIYQSRRPLRPGDKGITLYYVGLAALT